MDADTAAIRNPEQLEALVMACIARRRRCDPAALPPQRPFNELGLDSLEGVTLAAELEEELGRPVDPGLLFDHPTPRDLARHLAGAA